MCSCHSILECYIMFSGIKLSMGSFVLYLSKSVLLTLLSPHLCLGKINNFPYLRSQFYLIAL